MRVADLSETSQGIINRLSMVIEATDQTGIDEHSLLVNVTGTSVSIDKEEFRATESRLLADQWVDLFTRRIHEGEEKFLLSRTDMMELIEALDPRKKEY